MHPAHRWTWIGFSVGVWLCLACAGGAPAGIGATTSDAGDAVVMRNHTFTDPGSGGMPSHTILAPADWQASGNAWWPPPQQFNILPTQDITVTAPDGRQVRVGPTLGAATFTPAPHLRMPRAPEGTVEGGYPVMYLPDSPDAWRPLIAQAIARNEPAATNIHVDTIVPIPEMTAAFEPTLRPMREMAEQQNRQGYGTRQYVDAVVLAAPATFDRDGRSWDILFVFGVFQTGMDSQVGRQLYWSLEPNLSLRAPAGELDANLPLLMAIAYSVRPTQEWARMKSDHIAKMQGISNKGHADRMAILSQTNRQVSQTINDGFEQRMASMDETQRKVINTIREVDDFVESGTGGTSVQLPSHYDQVYSNGQGEYILTNSASYNPNTDDAVNNATWQTMERVE